MEEYTEFVLQNNQTMPDPIQDIIRISDLHSWYERLGDFTKAYPLLVQGEEPAYSFSPDFIDENKKNFHWTIVMDYGLPSYGAKITEDDGYYVIPDDMQKFMKKYPIYLDHDFCSNDNDKSNFLRHMCKKMCEEFWNGLVEYQKNNFINF